jgi:hypothetical protein
MVVVILAALKLCRKPAAPLRLIGKAAGVGQARQ